MVAKLASLCLLLSTAWASIPQMDGYHVVWSDDFNGAQGTQVDHSNWNQIAKSDNPNGEIETYTSGSANAHLSGDGQLYIIPKKSSSGWTSARLESVGAWACSATHAVVFQAELWVPNFTGSPAKFAGLWPAFWAKGNTFRTENIGWPACGEWDIFEVTDKLGDQNQGTLHYQDANGQHNGAFNGRVTYAGGQYHTWAFKVDRRNNDWTQQKLTWYLDGKEFYHVTGAMIGTTEQWHELAWSPFYIILNVAIGGGYPGNPTSSTVDGYDASMRVRYVAVYESN
ncbi:glycoside hydrolase family 16 protein [Xylogone sp. PMI_703]|nr:glycoside hydrolase family 16 protein [Xylogone sp. PMI_703]